MIVLLTPPPVTVIVPLLVLVDVFAVTASPNPPLGPLGDTPVTVSHDVALLLTVHDTFEVTVTPVVEAADVGLHDVGLTVSNTDDVPACVTEIVLLMPPPVTVIVPLLWFVELFTVTLTVKLPITTIPYLP